MLKTLIIALLAIILIAVIAYTINREFNKRYNSCYNSVVIHRGSNMEDLQKPIKQAYLVFGEMNPIWFGLPVTHNFSHWMVMLCVENAYYLISSSPYHYLEVINVKNYDGNNRVICYNYHGKQLYCYVLKRYNVASNETSNETNNETSKETSKETSNETSNETNKAINILQYCKQVVNYYNATGIYNLLRNNCQLIATYGLQHVLHVQTGDEIKRNYTLNNIIKELWNNRKNVYQKQ